MNELEIPNFADLLGEYLGSVPGEAFPYLLSQLERTAADRYRIWAEEVPEHKEGLLKCAASEDEIADRAEAMFPPSHEHRDIVAGVFPDAKAVYYAVFEKYPPVQQMLIQANAERQGASAWELLKAAYPGQAEGLDAMSALELSSADYLDELLPTLTTTK
jgi:hypothetical protein